MSDETDVIELEIITPDTTLCQESVSYVNIPSTDGSVGVLKNHAPMLCAVGGGQVRYRKSGQEDVRIDVGTGVAEVGHNKVTILVTPPEKTPDEEANKGKNPE